MTASALRSGMGPIIVSSEPVISGYNLWLDASDPATVTLDASGQLVSSWADKSGNAYDATPTGKIPYLATRLNGRWSLLMMGTQYLTSSAPWAGDATSSAFFVGTLWNLAAYRTLLCGVGGSSLQWLLNGATLEAYVAGVVGFASKGNGGVTEAEPFIAGIRAGSPSTQYLKTRGAAVTQETDGNASASATTLYIGRSNGSPYYWSGLIGEVITYPTTLSDADTLSVISGLSAKWDI